MQLSADTVAIVTGAGSGLGAALATALNARGAKIVAVGRRLEKLEETRATCAAPERYIPAPLDISDYDALETLVADTVETHGHLDLVVNNAATIYGGELSDLTPEEVQYSLHVNLLAPMWLTQLALPHLRQRPQACVVNISSMSGIVGAPSQNVYCAAKFGLRGFTEALRRELRGLSVTTLAVFPGAMDTECNTPEMRAIAAQQGVKLVVMQPPYAADRIVKALEKGKHRLIVARGPDRLLPTMDACFQRFISWKMGQFAPALREFMGEGNKWSRSRNVLEPLLQED